MGGTEMLFKVSEMTLAFVKFKEIRLRSNEITVSDAEGNLLRLLILQLS